MNLFINALYTRYNACLHVYSATKCSGQRWNYFCCQICNSCKLVELLLFFYYCYYLTLSFIVLSVTLYNITINVLLFLIFKRIVINAINYNHVDSQQFYSNKLRDKLSQSKYDYLF